ncbi:hypothetical protein HZ326_1376 [Fusarium oxysporum f. sp. albedinis]|nr:hypothetical protein HZ326_1376 [Fusarium oxysporum f. sp. albedinis]
MLDDIQASLILRGKTPALAMELTRHFSYHLLSEHTRIFYDAITETPTTRTWRAGRVQQKLHWIGSYTQTKADEESDV